MRRSAPKSGAKLCIRGLRNIGRGRSLVTLLGHRRPSWTYLRTVGTHSLKPPPGPLSTCDPSKEAYFISGSSGQAGQHPEATLEVLVRVIGPNGLPPQHRYTLREILDEMKEAMPEMERDPQFQRLYRVATH